MILSHKNHETVSDRRSLLSISITVCRRIYEGLEALRDGGGRRDSESKIRNRTFDFDSFFSLEVVQPNGRIHDFDAIQCIVYTQLTGWPCRNIKVEVCRSRIKYPSTLAR
jgi:hypothetical protein